MEQYSIDGRGRGEIYITLALVSIGLGYLTHEFSRGLPHELPWWIEVPSFAVWFGLVNVTFDRWLWRVRVFGRTLSRVPDFSGDWHGTIDAVDRDGNHRSIGVEVRIRQTWSEIEVRGRTRHGTTRSQIAGVRIDDDELRYEYQTEADVFDSEGRGHVGFCIIRLQSCDALEGYYYTLDGSTAKGTMHLARALKARVQAVSLEAAKQ